MDHAKRDPLLGTSEQAARRNAMREPLPRRARRSQMGSVLAVALLSSLASDGVAHAQLRPSLSALTAQHDTTVDRWDPGTNYGNSATFAAAATFKPESMRALVRFDQTAIANAIGAKQLVNATLFLTFASPAVISGSPAKLNVYRLTKPWSEGSATWDNMFPPFGTEPFNAAKPTASVPVASGATGQIAFDVSEDVLAFLDGTANYGWVIKDDGWFSGVDAIFASSEASSTPTRPVLLIGTVDAVQGSGNASLTFGPPGSLTIDSSQGNELVNVPLKGMNFATQRDVIDWAVRNLNATLQYDPSGNVIGAQGAITEVGDLIYVDEATLKINYVDDYIAAMLGGRTGIVTIAGVRFCLRPDGCEAGMIAKAPPNVDRRCDSTNAYCIKATSFNENFIVYKQVGTKVEQKEGGYHRDRHFCWKKKFIPWYCHKSSGSNRLELENHYQAASKDVLAGLPRITEKSNTTSIKQRQFSIFAKVKIKDDGSLGGGVGREFEVSGVCAGGSGLDLDTRKSATTSSSAGNVDHICPDDPGGPILF